MYYWDLSIIEIKEKLVLIQPYLHIKEEQSRLLIETVNILKTQEFMNLLSPIERENMYSNDEIERLNQIYFQLKELNEKITLKKRIETRTDAEKLLIEFRKRGV